MEVLGQRRRPQPAPPKYVFEKLTRPHHDPSRPWLVLLDDEVEPRVLDFDEPYMVLWSSIWTTRPKARVRFELEPRNIGLSVETNLQWTLLDVDDPGPALVGHMRKRLQQLINAEMRFTFGQ